MRHLLALAALLAASSPALAQEEQNEQTLIGGEFHSGGFGAPVVKFSSTVDKFAVFVGGRGGWIINHTFVLGGGGYGLANDIRLTDGGTRDLEFGYGGLELEYINSSDNLIHFTIYTLIGGGGISTDFGEDGVFVLEPSANAELNITRYFRVNAGAGYRWVSGVDTPGLSTSDMSAFVGQLSLKFGAF
jgi:hypothetical protein